MFLELFCFLAAFFLEKNTDRCEYLKDELRRTQDDSKERDIRMKGQNGLDAAAQILEKFPDARILLLTTFSDDEYIVKSLKVGAKGYLLKQDYQNIIPAVRAVYSGQTIPARAGIRCPGFCITTTGRGGKSLPGCI